MLILDNQIFTNYYNDCLILQQYSESTLKNYSYIINSLTAYLIKKKHIDLEKINKNTYLSYISSVLKEKPKLSVSSVNLMISAINSFTSFLCRKYNLCSVIKIKQKKIPIRLKNVIEPYEMLELLRNKDPDRYDSSSWIDYRNYAIAILLYSTGMRINEAMDVLLGDINDTWMRVENGKYYKSRVVPVNIHVHIALNNYKEVCPFKIYEFLWFTRDGKKLTSNSATKTIKNTFGFSAHYFRHAFATHLIQNDCDLLVVKEFLGHSCVSTTSMYTHIKPKHLQETIKLHPMYIEDSEIDNSSTI